MNNDFEIVQQEEIQAAEKTLEALIPDPGSVEEDLDTLAMVLIATQRQNRH